MNILIKYPTRGRPEAFKTHLNNIRETTRRRLPILVSADLDDRTMNNEEMIEWVRKEHPNVFLRFGAGISKIEACNRDISGFDEIRQWDLLILTSDDMRFIRQGWDERIAEIAQIRWPGSTDFFLHLNDGHVGALLPTLNICGREYYDRFGYVYFPGYKSICCDAENFYVSQMLGRHYYYPEILFNHDHPANGIGGYDDLYRRNGAFEDDDIQLYFKRLEDGFGLAETAVFMPQVVAEFIVKKKYRDR